jgi:hypothetical protein
MLACGLNAPEEMLLKIGKFLSPLKVHAPLFEEEDQQRGVLALCYRNGNKGIGMLRTTLSHAGVWDRSITTSPRLLPLISHNTTTAEIVYMRWLSLVQMFVACQGCTPWFRDKSIPKKITKMLPILRLSPC